MSSKINVNPGQYKVAGRERQGEDIVQARHKQRLAQSKVFERFEKSQLAAAQRAQGASMPDEGEPPAQPAAAEQPRTKPAARTKAAAKKGAPRRTAKRPAAAAKSSRRTAAPAKSARSTRRGAARATAQKRPASNRPAAHGGKKR